MKDIKIILCCLIVFYTSDFLFSQDKKDIEILNNIFEVRRQVPGYKNFTNNNTNEIKWIASGLFIVYKSFFSSQDGNQCNFYPSCSVYAIQSIKKNGFIVGFADAIDRLSRCNRLSPKNYVLFENTNLFFDPVW
jgi:putative component of membrane protein insertase Oxa1/YidC/SpoIIIJ protein YidD